MLKEICTSGATVMPDEMIVDYNATESCELLPGLYFHSVAGGIFWVILAEDRTNRRRYTLDLNALHEIMGHNVMYIETTKF